MGQSLCNAEGGRDVIGADIDRLDAFDRLEAKIDARFNAHAAYTVLLGVLVLFGDPIRELLGF